MEAGTHRSAKEGLCATCYAKAQVYCSKCKQRWYCSSACQEKDWKLGHKGDCGLADLPPTATVPAPPVRLLAESVERPVHSESSWRRLLDSADLSVGDMPPRGLRNVANCCYMNAVLQGLHHAVPLLGASLRNHRCPDERFYGARRGDCVCFRCDFSSLDTTSLAQRKATGEHILTLDDVVELHGLKSDSLNGRMGVIVKLPEPDASPEEARAGVMLQRDDIKAVRPQNLRFCYSRGPPQPPYEVLRWLPRLGEDFTFGAQEDAHEFLRSLLRLLEDEELKEHAQKLREAGGGAEALEPNVDLTALPSRIFGGMLVSQCTCTRRECVASTFSFEPFMDLQLDITEATDSLEDTLKLFTAPERLDKKNSWKCDTCLEVVRARKQITIYSAPTFLVLHLKRFRYGERGKVTKPVTFPSELNLRPYLCAGAPGAGRPMLYELRAVIVHLDKAGYSHFGHYIAFVRCAGERKGSSRWFLVDDNNTQEVEEAQVLQQQAYLLFYTRMGDARQEASKRTGAAEGAEALPSKCRGRQGAVCSFFASAEGLCTRCYLEEFGRSPPSPEKAAATKSPLPVEKPTAGAAPTNGYPAKPSAGPKAASKVVAPAKEKKKVGQNDPCPCGSGKKYKKCHGGV